MKEKLPENFDEFSRNEIREITMKFLRKNTPLITDAFLTVLMKH